MKKKYIIWDFDGTIANTNDIIIESWQATFRRYLGHEKTVREIEATFGETLKHTIAELIPGEDIDEVVEYYRQYQDSHQNKDIVYVFEGVRELLEELRNRGCLIGIGTSRTSYSLLNYMRMLDIEKYVDEIVTMNDVTSHKPDPETVEAVLLKLMEHEGLQTDEGIPESVRDEAVMIGDTKYDIGCAQNAGIDSVLIGWSHYVDEEAMAADGFEPTHRIAEPAELLDII